MSAREPIEFELLQRVRQIRRAKGWSLERFEQESGGEIKAAVLGSYERGSRTLSLSKLILIAKTLRIPLDALLSKEVSEQTKQAKVLDLRRLNALYLLGDEKSIPLKRLVESIVRKRGDWNGEVFSCRGEDFEAIGNILFACRKDLYGYLERNQILIITETELS